jgi:ketosteroid isomerase-like protein
MTMSDAHLTGDERVREVFARVRRGDVSVADLYADDGVVIVDGRRIEGREAIRGFYGRTIEARHPQPSVQLVLECAGSNVYAVVVDVPMDGDRHVRALDLFTIGADGIEQLEIFTRTVD